MPVNRAYKELGIACNTAYKVYSKIRYYIYQFVSRDKRGLGRSFEGLCPSNSLMIGYRP